MFKYLTLIVVFFGITLNLNSQEFKSLKKANSSQNLNDSTSIIYGSFVQRLGFTSGGFPQEIRLLNIVTNQVYTFNVKPVMKTSKQNSFCYYLKPGMYKVLSYFWIKSKWYGGEVHEELIYKNVDTFTKEYAKEIKNGNVDIDRLEPYYIEIRPNLVYYVGTWHFNTGMVSFSVDKENLDKELSKKKIDFNNAITLLPE